MNPKVAAVPVADAAELTAAREFLFEHLAADSSPQRRYRYEHCLRVAAIAVRVAPELADLELACLLHDVGKFDAIAAVDHGRAGAAIVSKYFASRGIFGPAANEILQGIAMHTDGRWNPRPGHEQDAAGRQFLTFPEPPSVLSRLVGDCDNIDRFSTYRIADTLNYFDFMGKSTAQQLEFIASYLGQLQSQYDYTCATAAAQEMWIANLDYQRDFFTRLAGEVELARD